MTSIIDKLFIGTYEDAKTAIVSQNFSCIVNCAKECDDDSSSQHGVYKKLYLSDSTNQSILHLFNEISALIEKNKTVLVHCYSGKSRSASFVLAYLIKQKGMSLTWAYTYVRERRSILPNVFFMEQLVLYDEQIHGYSNFDLNAYIVTFISETFGLEIDDVKQAFKKSNNDYDRTIDILFPLPNQGELGIKF